MRVLVTGANGFIGQHLIHSLESRKADINAFVRSREGSPSLKTKVFQGDIALNSESLINAVDDVDYVFHLIAKTHDFGKTNNSSADYFKINVDGTKNLLEACKNSRIKHFIYFSSIKVMAEESRKILDETFTPAPTTPYGQSKLEAENMVFEYGKQYGFKTTSIRLPLVYGSGNKGNVYKIMSAIDKGRFIMMGRGENRRSMVYVGNVVDASLKIAGNDKADGKVYIVTDGIDYTVKQLYETIARGLSKRTFPFYIPMSIARLFALAGDAGSSVFGKALPFNTDILNKLTDPLVFSSLKLQEELGFMPRYNLSNTIDKTVKWYRENQ